MAMGTDRDAGRLESILRRIDGRGYKAYKELEGVWNFGDHRLVVDHVQGDPFADPSRLTSFVTPERAALPTSAFAGDARALGTAAFLARALTKSGHDASSRRGTGKSGVIAAADPGQIVVRQSAVTVHADGGVEARFTVGLPANGRRISGRQAIELLTDVVPRVVRGSLFASAHDALDIERHAAANEDAEALREAVSDRGLVGFVADGALLPRRSGIDDRPLDPERVVPFASPDSLRVEIELPNAGTVIGMGIPEGVTLIVGGGFHGKSTLLRALQDGVYNHRPGDGRERTVARADTVKVRAEDGRSVACVDISSFIDGLPLGHRTDRFTTVNASGSTSQAATIIESLEAGASALLVDEDTSATNFMIRDRRMQELVPGPAEPITPFIDRVRALHDSLGVSTVLVLGGSGDYLDVADRVIRMTDYRPEDVSERARAVATHFPTGRSSEASTPLRLPEPRRPRRASLDPRRGRRERYVKVPDDRTLVFGTESIDLAAVEQLASRTQIRAMGLALAWIAEDAPADGAGLRGASVPEILDALEEHLDEHGLDGLADRRVGNLAAFRRYELAAALNRLRTLRME